MKTLNESLDIMDTRNLYPYQYKMKLTKKDFNLLLEAYRRYMMFHIDKDLKNAWLGLGMPSIYKSIYFIPATTEVKKVLNWYKLTEKGVEALENLIKEYPIPTDISEKNKLNDFLYTRNF